MNQADVARILALLTELYPKRFTATEATVAAWWEILRDVRFEHALQAVRGHASEELWPPSISQIMTRVKPLQAIEAPLALPEGRREHWDEQYQIQGRRAEQLRAENPLDPNDPIVRKRNEIIKRFVSGGEA